MWGRGVDGCEQGGLELQLYRPGQRLQAKWQEGQVQAGALLQVLPLKGSLGGDGMNFSTCPPVSCLSQSLSVCLEA